jgi:hypothetical protein
VETKRIKVRDEVKRTRKENDRKHNELSENRITKMRMTFLQNKVQHKTNKIAKPIKLQGRKGEDEMQ